MCQFMNTAVKCKDEQEEIVQSFKISKVYKSHSGYLQCTGKGFKNEQQAALNLLN